ncbi:MAG: TFIIB-type zinc ribbon-containing protein [Saccharofermentans sp.]|nr:TFIIB-type zinc ribbon-containing protein [Saccharofermentans sp.]
MADNDMNELGQIESATTMDVTDTKCPNCGATVKYDPATLSMTCEYCGYSKALPKPEDSAEVQEIDFNSAKIRGNQDWGTKKKSVVCQQCGGETIYDEAETASCCPFCGSTSVMPVDDKEDVMAPGGVVPFEVNREKASGIFKNWIKKKWFVPNEAKKVCEAKNFSGLYLPYWTYDSQTTSSYSAKLGFDKRVKRGDSYVTETTWRTYTGIYEEFIDDMVVYASKKTTDPNIKAVSSFDFAKLRTYSPEFVAGFAAERYTLGLDDGWKEAKVKIQSQLKSNLGSKLRKQYRADKVGQIFLSTNYDKITFKYVLAPIWIANFKFKDKSYNIAVNGQTGRISGQAPISPIKVAIAIIIAIAVIALFFYLNNM